VEDSWHMCKSIILTIGIPTYNGSKYIKTAIDSILNQLSDISLNEVEILVSDNASTDNTQEVLMDYLNNYKGIFSYFRNEDNVGFDRNVDLVVNRASGTFVWVLSDDDFIQLGGVAAVLESIRKYPRAAVGFVNYSSEIMLRTYDACLCLDGNDFFTKTAFKSSLISSNVINREEWLKSKLEKYFGAGWIHFGFLISCLARGQGFIIPEHYIVQGGERRWGKNGDFILVGLELARIFKGMPQYGYSREVKEMAVFGIKGRYIKHIPMARLEGLMVNRNLVSQFYELYRQYPSFWLIDIPLLLMPKVVYIVTRKMYRLKKKMALFIIAL